jgi:homocysteine S-methyltransferase
MGCVGDAYKPSEALSQIDAEIVHDFQAAQLAEAGVDFLFGSTLPSFTEALGMARSMAKTKKPYVLSFVIRENGTLLDGVLLSEAIAQIDTKAGKAPEFYMVNCVHPDVLQKALRADVGMAKLGTRLIGLQANTSSLSPEELAKSTELITEAAVSFGEKMVVEGRKNHLRILGGCCGTDPSHIEAIAHFAKAKV